MSNVSSLEERVDSVRRDLLTAVAEDEPLVIVKAPPGSGKTRVILEAAAFLRFRGQRVAVAGQTNSQVDDICKRLDEQFSFDAVRFCSSKTSIRPHLGDQIEWIDRGPGLPTGPTIVVATAAKWGWYGPPNAPFDWLLIDEAWQLAFADFMLLDQVAPRMVMVGDPGQIAPVVSIDTARWATSDAPPYVAAPELLLNADGVETVELELPASYRLPHDSVIAVGEFYDFKFDAWAEPGKRTVNWMEARDPSALDSVLNALVGRSIIAATIATPPEGPPLEEDRELAEFAVDIVRRMVERGGILEIDDTTAELRPSDIGLCATHRRMNARMAEALGGDLAGDVLVDTAERWQGLERPIMVIVHPVSGTTDPSGFDLQTERLCVMASRHKVGLIVVSRDHIKATLDELIPVAEQHVGLPDITGRGLGRQKAFWDDLVEAGAVISVSTRPKPPDGPGSNPTR